MLLPGAEALAVEAPDGPLALLRRDGFARLGRVVSPEGLAALRRRADQIMLGEIDGAPFFFQHDAASYGELPYGKGWQGPSLGYRKLEKLERDPVFRQLIENPLFGRIAHARLGPEVALCRAVLFTKAARGGSELPWHQDGGPFWGLSRDPELQIWTALDDAPVGSGCLEVLPGSHTAGLATPHGGVVPKDVVERSGAGLRALSLPARAGESILLHNHTWHRSLTNPTLAPRRALTVCLIDAATRCTRKRAPRQFLRLFESRSP